MARDGQYRSTCSQIAAIKNGRCETLVCGSGTLGALGCVGGAGRAQDVRCVKVALLSASVTWAPALEARSGGDVWLVGSPGRRERAG